MSIDFSKFKDGDEVAVIFVGKWARDMNGDHGLAVGRGTFFYSHTLPDAVDAYKIEPEPKKGDLFRSFVGKLIVCEGRGLYRCILNGDGVVSENSGAYRREDFGILTPVKVVEK